VSNNRHLWLPQKKNVLAVFANQKQCVLTSSFYRLKVCISVFRERNMYLSKTKEKLCSWTDLHWQWSEECNVTGFRKPAFVLSGLREFKVVFCGFQNVVLNLLLSFRVWEALWWRHVLLCKDHFFPFLLWLPFHSLLPCGICHSVVKVFFLQSDFSFAICSLLLYNLA